MSFPVFDLHCDTALSLVHKGKASNETLRKNHGHIDLERAKTLPGYCQCFACFTTTGEELPNGITVTTLFEREMDAVLGQIEENSDLIRLVYSAEDVEKNQDAGLMSGILTIEGPAGFGFDPGLLEDLHRAGFRISSLGWNEKNVLTGSNVTGGGLTDLGKEYVKEAQRVGIAVDVSHISDEGFWDIMKITQKPVIATHSNSRAVWNHSRNLTDDMFQAICETGGVAGFNLYSAFIGREPNLDTACRHILHFLELDCEGRHIALGGDLDGCDQLPKGFDGVDSYPAMAECLLRYGVGETIVRRIFWKNALEVLRACST